MDAQGMIYRGAFPRFPPWEDFEIPVEISLSPLETAEGSVVLSSIRDVTERRQQEKERENLIEDLRHCVMPYTCPHGRPTIIEMNLRELEKKFGRSQ